MHPRGRGHRGHPWAATAVIAVWLVGTACTPDAEVPRGLGDPIVAGEADGVCGLLAVEEVEVAVNRSLAGTQTADTPVDGANAETGTAEAANGTSEPGEGGAAQEAANEEAAAADDSEDTAEEPDGSDPPVGPDSDDAPAPARRGQADGPSPLLPGMEMCGLGSPRAGAAWGLLTESAEEQYRRYGQWHEQYLESVKVDGHEAMWDPTLRTLLVLAGDDVAFGLTLTAEDPVLAEGEDEAAYLKDRAIELAGRALRRL